jgi:hypothetical protein
VACDCFPSLVLNTTAPANFVVDCSSLFYPWSCGNPSGCYWHCVCAYCCEIHRSVSTGTEMSGNCGKRAGNFCCMTCAARCDKFSLFLRSGCKVDDQDKSFPARVLHVLSIKAQLLGESQRMFHVAGSVRHIERPTSRLTKCYSFMVPLIQKGIT